MLLENSQEQDRDAIPRLASRSTYCLQLRMLYLAAIANLCLLVSLWHVNQSPGFFHHCSYSVEWAPSTPEVRTPPESLLSAILPQEVK